MEILKLFFEIIGALGSIGTMISAFFLLKKLSSKLKISVEFPIKTPGEILITINNNTSFDNEIKYISFHKGNPNNCWKESSLAYFVDLSETGFSTNPNTGNIIIEKNSSLEIPIPCKCVACNYDTLGEMFGKPFDTIFVLVKDRKGHKYCRNTHCNIEYFRKVSA